MIAIGNVIGSVLIMAGITFLTRLFPFLFFRKKEPPEIIRFIQIYIPPMVMMILVLYSLVGTEWTHAPYGIPELLASAVVVLLHVWRKNAFISIFVGTGLYMAMVQTGFPMIFF